MEEKKSSKKGIIIAIVALVLAAAVAGGIFLATRVIPKKGDKNIVVEVYLGDRSCETFEINTSAQYLKEALEEKKLIDGEQMDYAYYVTTVNGIEANADKQQWWCFTKKNQMMATGVEDTPIEDGDVYQIYLMDSW